MYNLVSDTLLLYELDIMWHAWYFSTALQEVCERESFKAECATDEILIVRRARYGRMKEGRCVTTEYGVIGCSTDVLLHMDSACSGRRKCDVKVATVIPESVKPCHSDLRSYLEVAYACVKGRPVCGIRACVCVAFWLLIHSHSNSCVSQIIVFMSTDMTCKCSFRRQISAGGLSVKYGRFIIFSTLSHH